MSRHDNKHKSSEQSPCGEVMPLLSTGEKEMKDNLEEGIEVRLLSPIRHKHESKRISSVKERRTRLRDRVWKLSKYYSNDKDTTESGASEDHGGHVCYWGSPFEPPSCVTCQNAETQDDIVDEEGVLIHLPLSTFISERGSSDAATTPSSHMKVYGVGSNGSCPVGTSSTDLKDDSDRVLKQSSKLATDHDLPLCKTDDMVSTHESQSSKIRTKCSDLSSTFSKDRAPKDANEKKRRWALRKVLSSTVGSSSELGSGDKVDLKTVGKPRRSRTFSPRRTKRIDEDAWYSRPKSERFNDPEKARMMDMVFFDTT